MFATGISLAVSIILTSFFSTVNTLFSFSTLIFYRRELGGVYGQAEGAVLQRGKKAAGAVRLRGGLRAGLSGPHPDPRQAAGIRGPDQGCYAGFYMVDSSLFVFHDKNLHVTPNCLT